MRRGWQVGAATALREVALGPLGWVNTGGSRRSRRLCLQLLSSNVVNDLMLLESLLDNLAAWQKDPSASVRRLVLRGLANVASGSPDKVSWPLWGPRHEDSGAVV